MFSPSGKQFEIAFADQRVTVVEVGGGLRTFSVGTRDLIDGYGPGEMCPSGRGQVLMPWPNRLAGGAYEFAGRDLELPVNEPATGSAIHGLVRWAAWSVTEREPHRLVIRHDLHPQPGYPFALAISIEYVLSADGLRVSTTATNVGGEPCPFGAGAHPYLRPDSAVGRSGDAASPRPKPPRGRHGRDSRRRRRGRGDRVRFPPAEARRRDEARSLLHRSAARR